MVNLMERDRLREKLRHLSFAPGQIKVGELGGGQDTPFEQAFSNLAHAYLKDKAPKLLDYEVGFQLIEKNQENTKAVGVFGFRVGSGWLYAPVFFLNGDLKGHELLYVKQQDMFVPLKENWINYLLGRKPSVLGEGMNRNLSLAGVMPPNLYQLSRSPHKFASAGAAPPALAGWAHDVLPDLAYFATRPVDGDPKYAGLKGLPDLLKEAGEPLLRHLLEDVGPAYPAVLAGVDACYGPGLLTGLARDLGAAKRAAALPPTRSLLKDAASCCVPVAPRKPAPPPKPKPKSRMSVKQALGEALRKRAAQAEKGTGGKVKVVTMDEVRAGSGPDLLHDLDAGERRTLLKERVVVKDTRDDKDVTLAYATHGPVRLWNPDRTNLYQVLVKPGEFRRCLVAFGPYDHTGANTFCTVVDVKNRRWINIHPGKVWVESEADDEAFRGWFKKLPDADSLGKGTRLVLTGYGQATCPFQVTESGGTDALDTRVYDVNFRNWADLDQPLYQNDYPRAYAPMREGPFPGSRIRLTGFPGTKIKVTSGDVCVPLGCKQLALGKPEEKPEGTDKDHDYDADDGGHELIHNRDRDAIVKIEGADDLENRDVTAGTQPPPLQLGNLIDLHVLLAHATKPLKVYADGNSVTLDESRKLNKVGALRALVVDYGLREKAARAVLAEAERARHLGRSFTCLLKRAAPGGPQGDMVAGAPNSPPFPEPNVGWDPMTGSNVPTMTDSEFNVKVPDLSASRTDRSIYQPQGPDPRSMQVAQQAAQTGQREVFDTAMLGSMLKAVRPESMVDKYLPDLMKGMDRLGRVLYQFYWHGEEFEERYGKQDMPELEDGLRNGFEAVGDIILALKRQTVDPYPDEGTDVDLSALANQ